MRPEDKSAGGGGRRPRRHKARACPICGEQSSQDYRPFCSRRCADIDLGRWLGGCYVIEGAPVGAGSGGDDEDQE